jgi:hypothetical protein
MLKVKDKLKVKLRIDHDSDITTAPGFPLPRNVKRWPSS